MKEGILSFLPDLQKITNSDSSLNINESIGDKEYIYSNIPSKLPQSTKPANNTIGTLEELDIKKEKNVVPANFQLPEGVQLRAWKNVKNTSAKVIDIYENTAVLDCLVDRDLKQYAEIEFPLHFFANLNIKVGSFCIISRYERENEIKFEFIGNPGLDLSNDFPRIDFVNKYKDSPIFKKNNW